MPVDSEDFVDFTHPDYVPTATPKGIPYDKFHSPQKLAGLLLKAARKSNPRPGKGVGRGKAGTGKATAIAIKK